jgi:hypothetical protein
MNNSQISHHLLSIEKIFETDAITLNEHDLADLLFCLNYVGFGLGQGCCFVVKDELKYRAFQDFYPLLFRRGLGVLIYLCKFHTKEVVCDLTLNAFIHSGVNEDDAKDVYRAGYNYLFEKLK